MFAAGVSPGQVARRLRVSRKSACAWHAAWRAGGADALCSKGPSGYPSRMKPSWRAWLEQALEEGPAAHGWSEDQRWTLARVTTLVACRFHVRFNEPQMSRILHQMGWSVQVLPQPSAGRYPQCTGPRSGTSRRWPPGSRRPGRGWKDGEGPGRMAVLRRRGGALAAAAEGAHMVPSRAPAAGEGDGEGRGQGLAGRAGVRPIRAAHPADSPDAGTPSWPFQGEEGLSRPGLLRRAGCRPPATGRAGRAAE